MKQDLFTDMYYVIHQIDDEYYVTVCNVKPLHSAIYIRTFPLKEFSVSVACEKYKLDVEKLLNDR